MTLRIRWLTEGPGTGARHERYADGSQAWIAQLGPLLISIAIGADS